jgi:hypothetical protein
LCAHYQGGLSMLKEEEVSLKIESLNEKLQNSTIECLCRFDFSSALMAHQLKNKIKELSNYSEASRLQVMKSILDELEIYLRPEINALKRHFERYHRFLPGSWLLDISRDIIKPAINKMEQLARDQYYLEVSQGSAFS